MNHYAAIEMRLTEIFGITPTAISLKPELILVYYLIPPLTLPTAGLYIPGSVLVSCKHNMLLLRCGIGDRGWDRVYDLMSPDSIDALTADANEILSFIEDK
ncbi:MAG: hypothetical protein DRR06_13310 [Gammaproteobacteria bacterium]|nr:MAG: hypothetical protein DRR06_13310 [Gammaproteobacteria bacterium]